METAARNAHAQRQRWREDFAQSAENRRMGPDRLLTAIERGNGGEGDLRQAQARNAAPAVDAHRRRFAARVRVQASVMAIAARALQALHAELHDDLCGVAGHDYADWHPVFFGSNGNPAPMPLAAIVALAERIAADARAAE